MGQAVKDVNQGVHSRKMATEEFWKGSRSGSRPTGVAEGPIRYMAFFPHIAQCLRPGTRLPGHSKAFQGHMITSGVLTSRCTVRNQLTHTGRGTGQPGHRVVCSVMGLGCKGKVRISPLVLSENSYWELRFSVCGSQELILIILGVLSSPFSLAWAYILLYNASSEGIWFIQQAQHPCRAQTWDCPLNMPFLVPFAKAHVWREVHGYPMYMPHLPDACTLVLMTRICTGASSPDYQQKFCWL